MKTITIGAVFLVVLIIGILIGGKNAEYDINKKIENGEIFGNIDVKNFCEDSIIKNPIDSSIQDQCDEKSSAEVRDYINRTSALRKIGDDLAKAYIEEKLKDVSLYKKINVKNEGEFLNFDLEKGWDSQYASKYKQEFSDAAKLRGAIIGGDIFRQDLIYGSVYYAKNYFNWDVKKLKNTMQPLCDGLGCDVPNIIFADNKNIYWTTLDCSGGVKPEDADQNFYYNSEICSTLLTAMMNYSK